jgi:hypothetical protein
MPRDNEPAFAKHAPELLEKLEARTKTLVDTEASLTAFTDAIKQIRTLLARMARKPTPRSCISKPGPPWTGRTSASIPSRWSTGFSLCSSAIWR